MKSKNTVQRIKEYIDYKGISVRKFEESVGFSNGSFGSQYKNNKTIGVDKVEYILHVYDDINPIWLLTGKGPMLCDSKTPEDTTLGCTPVVTPVSPAEESIIYNMYKDEKAEKERMIKDKDIKIDHLNHALAETKAELAVIKAQFSDYKTYSEEKLRQLEAGVPGGKTSAKHVSTKKHSSPNADDATSATAP